MPWVEEKASNQRGLKGRESFCCSLAQLSVLSRPFRPQGWGGPVRPRASGCGLNPGLRSPGPLGRTRGDVDRWTQSHYALLVNRSPHWPLATAKAVAARAGGLALSVTRAKLFFPTAAAALKAAKRMVADLREADFVETVFCRIQTSAMSTPWSPMGSGGT